MTPTAATGNDWPLLGPALVAAMFTALGLAIFWVPLRPKLLKTVVAAATGSFRSPTAAQVWFEWRQKGWIIPLNATLGLVTIAIMDELDFLQAPLILRRDHFASKLSSWREREIDDESIREWRVRERQSNLMAW